jgi:hypothetical protein
MRISRAFIFLLLAACAIMLWRDSMDAKYVTTNFVIVDDSGEWETSGDYRLKHEGQ